MDDARRRPANGGTLIDMALADWCDLDLAYLLIFETHPDLEGEQAAAFNTVPSSP